MEEEQAETKMSKETKKNVLLSFDSDLLIDAKKILFASNMTLQQYVTFLLHRLALGDDLAKELLNNAVLFNEEQLTSEQKNEVIKVSPGNLYSLFERQDQQEK